MVKEKSRKGTRITAQFPFSNALVKVFLTSSFVLGEEGFKGIPMEKERKTFSAFFLGKAKFAARRKFMKGAPIAPPPHTVTLCNSKVN